MLSLEHRKGYARPVHCPGVSGPLCGDSGLQTAPAVPELALAAVQGHVLQG